MAVVCHISIEYRLRVFENEVSRILARKNKRL
jgi:hypothetical protein